MIFIFNDRLGAFVLGFVAILGLHIAHGWWLNSGSGVLRTVIVLLVLGFLTVVWRSESRWARALALWGGSMTAAAAVLFWLGPGNIYPIVLAFAAALSAAAVFVGASLGAMMRRTRS